METHKYITQEAYEDALTELDDFTSTSVFDDKESREFLNTILEIFGLEIEC